MYRMAWLTVVLLIAAPSVAAAPKNPRGLPNLVSLVPSDLSAAPLYTPPGDPVEGRWAIRFTSVVANRGRGPLVVKAHRPAVGRPCAPDDDPTNQCESGDMAGDQVVIRADGTRRTYRNVAVVFFDQFHFHWHMRDAERYELRTATCEFGRSDPAADGRRALSLLVGLSAGWRDDYPSYEDGKPLEGQQLDLTGLAAGNYVLVNRVNPNGAFVESTLKDNASSVLFSLSWPRGTTAKPSVRRLRACPGTARCRPR